MGAIIANPAVMWGLLAAFPAVLAEYLYRIIDDSWWKYLWAWVPIQLAIGYCIYRLVNVPNSSLLDAFVVWAFSTTAMRVVVSTVFLGDTVKGGTWFALGLLVMARIAQSFWGR